jgi:transposase
MKRYDFTDEEIDWIKQMVNKGMGHREIGKVFGLSQTPISNLLKKLGIMAFPDWTHDQLSRLKALHAEGKTQTEIAEAIGRGQSSVSRMYEKLGLDGIDTTVLLSEKIAEIAALHNKGMEAKDIAIKLDLGETTIRRALDKAGIEIARNITDEEKARIVGLRKSGMVIDDIAKELGRSVGTVLDHLHGLGMSGRLPPEPEPTHKTCNICNEEKPIDSFLKLQAVMDKNREIVRYTRHSNCDDCRMLRMTVSQSIRSQLKKSEASKEGASCLDHLPYSIAELRQHLEKLFEPWMTWANWGHYNKADWNDDDQSTWVWHIDHIIPHASFKYTSMEDPSFQECWALYNLRPYSAKANVRDNDRGLRSTNNKTPIISESAIIE